MRDLVLTDAARKLRDSAGLTDEQVRSLGKRLIREADIAALVDAYRLPIQQRVHREITDGFASVKVRCDELSTPEVAGILDELKPRFPMFFAALDDQGRCVVSIGSVHRELVLDGGQVQEHRCLTIGLTYDHRVINGPDAVEFLTAFKSTVEKTAEVRL